MSKFTFAVNKVDHVGRHTPTNDVVSVEATDETTARSVARAALKKRAEGPVQFHPGQLKSVTETPKPKADPKPTAPEPSVTQ